jgi:citrate synthase
MYLRGVDVCELMEQCDLGGATYFYLTGRRPTPGIARMVNAIMIGFMDHGIAPASVVSRIVASAGVPITPSVVAGLLTIGDLQTGTGDLVARLLVDHADEAGTPDEIAARLVAAHAERGERIVGFGHPLHGEGDPRVRTLVRIAEAEGLVGRCLELAFALERALHERTGRALRLNLVGTAAAILADLGVDPRVIRAMVLIPRAAGLTAHYQEEVERERGWRLPVDPDTVEYDGPPPRSLDAVADGTM